MLSPTEYSRIHGLFKVLGDFPVLFKADLIFKDFSRTLNKPAHTILELIA